MKRDAVFGLLLDGDKAWESAYKYRDKPKQIHAQRLISQQDLWPGIINCWHDSGHALEFTKGPHCIREYCAHVIKLDVIALKSSNTLCFKDQKQSKQ